MDRVNGNVDHFLTPLAPDATLTKVLTTWTKSMAPVSSSGRVEIPTQATITWTNAKVLEL